MNQPHKKDPLVSPDRIAQQSATLETELNKSIANQHSKSEIRISIDRRKYSDEVILRAVQEIMPRYYVSHRIYLLSLRDLLAKKTTAENKATFEKKIDIDPTTDSEDVDITSRLFRAAASDTFLAIQIKGVDMVPSENGKIEKSYFNHELSAGKILKGGIIDFREINKFPIVKAGDKLFYISHEKQGQSGISYDGAQLPVHDALPYPIQHGEGVKRVDDETENGTSSGYYLSSIKTGVVLLLRDEKEQITGVDILEEVSVKKLDYSTGNIGSQYTCPISINVETICAGFKIRVNGRVQAGIVDGGEIITNNDATVTEVQAGSSILALNHITAGTVIKSKLISEKGTLTIENSLIDSELSAPEVRFEKSKGLVTNNRIESENLQMAGCYFTAENKIYFGNSLFVDERENKKLLERARAEKEAQINNKKLVMGQLQLELKRLTRLASEQPSLVKSTKALIMATNKMEFQTIYKVLDALPEIKDNPITDNLRTYFQDLENIPGNVKQCEEKEDRLSREIKEIRERMTRMSLKIEGSVRRAGTIKIYCGIQDEDSGEGPDFIVESENNDDRQISITGSFSRKTGFEIVT